jgi:hypothetical protein
LAFCLDLLKLLTLHWGERFAHVQVVIDSGFLQCDPRRADFLQLAVDGRAVGLVGSEKVVQINALDLKIGPVANLRLPEVGFLLPDLRGLVGGNAKLLTDVWIV